MGIYIVKKTFFYGNEVGGALRGTRQGPVLKYLWSTTGLLVFSLLKNESCEILFQKTHGSRKRMVPENSWFQLLLDICILIKLYMYSQTYPSGNLY